jgi:hypothetical protein
MSNLDFWNKYGKTDPAFVKPSQKGLSSIDGYYIFQQATKAFGMCGIGWGYEILEEKYQVGAPVLSPDKKAELGNEIDHMLLVKLWFMQGDKKGELSHYGITRYVYGSKYGLITDEEAPKKSLTDAIKKCLSMLGFCSDVYMGKFEDSAYVDAARGDAALENAINKDEEKAKQAKAAVDEVAKVVALIDSSVSLSEVEGLYKSCARNRAIAGEKSLLIKLSKSKDSAKERLTEKGIENETV